MTITANNHFHCPKPNLEYLITKFKICIIILNKFCYEYTVFSRCQVPRHFGPKPPLSPAGRGSGTPRPKTISARDSSARTFRSIFQSGTARPTLVGLLGPFFLFIFFGGWGWGNLLFYSVYICSSKQDSRNFV